MRGTFVFYPDLCKGRNPEIAENCVTLSQKIAYDRSFIKFDNRAFE